MRLVRYRSGGSIQVGAVVGDKIVDLRRAAIAAGKEATPFESMIGLLQAGEAAVAFARQQLPNSSSIALSSVELDYPVESRKIIAIGLNYKDHAAEAKQNIPAAPLCFAKFTSSLSGPFDPIRLPAADAEVDYEGELGVVIGTDAKGVSEADAMKYVAGYVVCNDVSARKWQFADGQWTRGKSCDTFAPCGPMLVTKDEVPDPGNLRITTRLNGAVMQNSNTDQLIFSVPKLVSYLSHAFTLQAGDLIATGTPSGVGFSRKPPVYLQDGDVVEVEIEKLGKITNRVERGY